VPTFPLPRFERARLEIEQAKMLKEIIDEADDAQSLVRGRPMTKTGDPRQLRGVPIVGPGGFGGAILGTRPDQALLAKQARAEPSK